MATRTTTSRRGTGSAAKGRGKKGDPAPRTPPKKLSNRETVFKKLEELMQPVREQYGVSAFEELAGRIETTIKEFSGEVDTLFNQMVDQSREDYEKMKSLLEPETVDEEGTGPVEPEENQTMSEFERKLEEMEKRKSRKKKGADSGADKK